jgi:hypothetical protein
MGKQFFKNLCKQHKIRREVLNDYAVKKCYVVYIMSFYQYEFPNYTQFIEHKPFTNMNF